MKSYIFVSSDGHTFQPGSTSATPDIENLQVIGFGRGENPEAAVRLLLLEEPAIKETNFDEIMAFELGSQKPSIHSLKRIAL